MGLSFNPLVKFFLFFMLNFVFNVWSAAPISNEESDSTQRNQSRLGRVNNAPAINQHHRELNGNHSDAHSSATDPRPRQSIAYDRLIAERLDRQLNGDHSGAHSSATVPRSSQSIAHDINFARQLHRQLNGNHSGAHSSATVLGPSQLRPSSSRQNQEPRNQEGSGSNIATTSSGSRLIDQGVLKKALGIINKLESRDFKDQEECTVCYEPSGRLQEFLQKDLGKNTRIQLSSCNKAYFHKCSNDNDRSSGWFSGWFQVRPSLEKEVNYTMVICVICIYNCIVSGQPFKCLSCGKPI